MQIAGAIQAFGGRLVNDSRCLLLEMSSEGRRKVMGKQQTVEPTLLQVARQAQAGIICTHRDFVNQAEAAIAVSRGVGKKHHGYAMIMDSSLLLCIQY